MPKRTCTIDGCDRPHQARGYCNSHYKTIIQPDRHKARVEAECAWCGTTVTKKATDGERYRPTCSTTCRRNLQFPPACELPEDHWARWFGSTSAWPRCPIDTCMQCGFKYLRKAGTTACGRCKARDAWAKRRDSQGGKSQEEWMMIDRSCTQCHSTFHSPHPARLTCSPQCRRRARQQVNGAKWISKAKRIALYERDEYMCHICGELTEPDAPTGSAWFPSLDHIVPVSQGGSDDPDNLATCHMYCNAVRATQTVDQARELLGA